MSIRSTSSSAGNVPRSETRVACTPEPSRKPDTSRTSSAERVAYDAPSSRLSLRSRPSPFAENRERLICPGTGSSGALSIGPSITSSKRTRVVVPVVLPASKSPSTRTTIPTRSAASDTAMPSTSIVAVDRSHRTPFTKMLPKALIGP